MAGRPTEREIRLGATLRQARQDAGLTQHEAAEKTNRSQPTITRIEAGTRPPSPDELRELVELYAPGPALRRAIDGLSSVDDLPRSTGLAPNPRFLEMLEAVETATEILTFHSERTPAQLQSAQYTLLQYRLAGDHLRETDVLRARERRLRIFTREQPPRYRALLTESSLLRMPGGSTVIIKQQAQYLLELLERYPRFSLRIVHNHAAVAYIDADFTLLTGPRRQSDMLYIPFGLDGRLIKDRRGIEERAEYWRTAHQAALSEDDSRKFIHELAQSGRVE